MNLPPILATHVPLPVVYRSEARPVGRRPSWWPDVPERCPICKPAGWLHADEDRVVCASCGRATHEVLEKRPAPLPTFDDRQKPGPKGTPTLCLDCGRGIHSRSKRCQWCNGQYQRKMQSWRAALLKAGRRCTLDGCDVQVWASKSGSLCKEHWKLRERNRRAEKTRVAS